MRAEANGLLGKAGVKSVAELAQQPEVRQALTWLSVRRRWIDEKHLELCRIPAPTFQEDARAGWMAEEFRAIGYDVSVDRAGNVIAGLRLKGSGPVVCISAHLDTVLSPARPEEVRVDERGRFVGPGVADNGSGLAALVGVAAALSRNGVGGDGAEKIIFVANVGEEGEGNLSGMRYLCRPSGWGRRIGWYVVVDGPSTDHVTARAVASRRFEIAISGPGGHSWSDFGIGNPVHALSRAITLFTEDQTERLQASRNGSRLSFNFGFIEGGASVNAIPALARAKVDLRSEQPEEMAALAEALRGAVEKALHIENIRAEGAKLSARVREIGYRPGGRLPEDAPILEYLRAVDGFLGIRSRPDSASTDANIPLSLGRQAISIGAGGQGGGAHTREEWYDPAGREIGLKRIYLLALLLARAAGAGP